MIGTAQTCVVSLNNAEIERFTVPKSTAVGIASVKPLLSLLAERLPFWIRRVIPARHRAAWYVFVHPAESVQPPMRIRLQYGDILRMRIHVDGAPLADGTRVRLAPAVAKDDRTFIVDIRETGGKLGIAYRTLEVAKKQPHWGTWHFEPHTLEFVAPENPLP
jgi:hypothetical protein